jgi:hypothetical protein
MELEKIRVENNGTKILVLMKTKIIKTPVKVNYMDIFETLFLLYVF